MSGVISEKEPRFLPLQGLHELSAIAIESSVWLRWPTHLPNRLRLSFIQQKPNVVTPRPSLAIIALVAIRMSPRNSTTMLIIYVWNRQNPLAE